MGVNHAANGAVSDGRAVDLDVVLPGPVVHALRVVDGTTHTRDHLRQVKVSMREANSFEPCGDTRL